MGSGHPIDVIKRLFSDKKWDDLALYCKKMLEDDPKDMVALQNISSACIMLNRLDDAISYSDAVLELNSHDEYALKNKIYAMEKQGMHADVVACCDKLLEKNTSDTWALDSKGLALNATGRQEDALLCYEQSLRHDPGDTTALMNKAATLFFLKRYDDAIACYDAAQRADGSLRGAASARSEIYQILGMEDEAFLAAQGLLDDDVARFKEEAKKRKMRVFDWFCLNEFNELEEKEKRHQEKINSKG